MKSVLTTMQKRYVGVRTLIQPIVRAEWMWYVGERVLVLTPNPSFPLEKGKAIHSI